MAVNKTNNSGNQSSNNTGRGEHATRTQDVDNESRSLDERLIDAMRDIDDPAVGEEILAHGRDDYREYGLGNITTLDELLVAPFDGTEGNQRVEEIMGHFNDAVKTMTARSKVFADIGLIDFDARRKDLEYPAIIGYHLVKNASGNVDSVTYSVLLVEDSVELDPIQQPYNGRQIDVPFTMFDVYDDVYNAEVLAVLANRLGDTLDENTRMIFSGVSTVPREMPTDDAAQVQGVLLEFAKQVVSAVVDETLQVGADTTQASLGRVLVDGNYRLSASLTPKPKLVDVTGMPIHADMLITTRAYAPARSTGQGQRRSNVRKSFELSSVAVAMELMYVEPENNRSSYGRRDAYTRQPREENVPHYIGNVVITNISNEANMTLATTLMAISTAMITHADEVYPDMLRPNRDKDVISIGDLGSIGYEVEDADGNFGKIDLNSAEFIAGGDAALYELVYSEIGPELMLSIDIPEALLGARPIKTLEKTAVGNNPRNAIERVVHTLDTLTDGRFLNIADQDGWRGDRVLSTSPVMIPMGYWVDPKGNRRDLRELNYLAALDYAGSKDDAKFISAWENTFRDENQTMAVAERIQLMQQMVGADAVVVKGYAWRYPLDRDFIEAASRATVEMGIAPSFNNLAEADQRRLRSNRADYNDYLVNSKDSNYYASNTRYSGASSRTSTIRRQRQYR